MQNLLWREDPQRADEPPFNVSACCNMFGLREETCGGRDHPQAQRPGTQICPKPASCGRLYRLSTAAILQETVRCPIWVDSCRTIFSEKQIERLAEPKELTAWRNRISLRAIEHDPDFRYCANEKCGSGQYMEDCSASPIMHCQNCGAKVCTSEARLSSQMGDLGLLLTEYWCVRRHVLGTEL